MSCDDVCLDMDYDGCNDFYSESMRRAAKPHKCRECGREILKGEQYQVASGKSEGDFWTNRTCAECAEIRTAFVCGTWIFGELWESVREQIFPRWDEMKAIDCLAKLTTDTAIAKMRAEYARFQES